MRKSKAGIKTPQADKDRVLEAFRAAQQDDLAHHRQREDSDDQDDDGHA